ncbi:MAG: VTC domain-containing protein, partial [Sulfobacillus sp.]
KLSAELNEFIVNKNCRETVCVVYQRLALGSAQQRVCLDTNVQFQKAVADGCKASPGSRVPDMAFRTSLFARRLDFAVLEVKTIGQDKEVAWLQELLDREWIFPVPKFSKFLTGTFLLFNNELPNDVVPYWMPQLGKLSDQHDPLKLHYGGIRQPLPVFPRGLRPELLLHVESLFTRRMGLCLKMGLVNAAAGRMYFSPALIFLTGAFFLLAILGYFLDRRAIVRQRQLPTLDAFRWLEKLVIASFFCCLLFLLVARSKEESALFG